MMEARERSKKERERRMLLQNKIRAACVIQRAWRAFKFRRNMRKRAPGPATIYLKQDPTRVSRAANRKKPRKIRLPGQEPTEKEREIAALVIQLAWRRHVQSKLRQKIESRLKTRAEILRDYLDKQRRARQVSAVMTLRLFIHYCMI